MLHLRTSAVIAVIALLGASCSGVSRDRDSENVTTTTREQADTPVSVNLAVLDQDGSIVVVDIDGTMVERRDPLPDERYTQPIWASSSTIVSARIGIGGNRLMAFSLGGNETWSVELATPPFFYLARPTSGVPTVVSLRSDNGDGLVAEIIGGSDTLETVGTGSPFYMSWDPSSDRLATHVGGGRLDIFDGSSETISTAADGFQAPVWLEPGLVTLRTGTGETVLSLWNGSSFVDVAAVRSAARFVGAGRRIAIQTGAASEGGGIQAITRAQALPAIPSGVLMVVDLEAGSFTSVTSDVSPFFQWDRKGRRLLFATLVDDPAPALQWHVWENGTIENFASFAPDPSWFRSVIPFSDQCAQSISLWSPDGSAFAYPGLVDGEPRIFVQKLDEDLPHDIAAGVWVTWAPRTDDRRQTIWHLTSAVCCLTSDL